MDRRFVGEDKELGDGKLYSLSFPPVPKPISFVEYTRKELVQFALQT
jgi:hypothetical protein